MSNLYNASVNSIGIGQVIQASGPPNSCWLPCAGQVLLKADYPEYVSKCSDLHPLRWSFFRGIPISNPSSYSPYAISNIGDYVVIVGANNLVHYSADGGLTWNTSTLNSTNAHYDITNNGSRFVVSEYGAAYAEYSDDYGATWTRVSCPGATSWRYVAWNGTYFLAIALSSLSTVARSTDGITWSSVSTGVSYSLGGALKVDNSGTFLTNLNYYGSGFDKYFFATSTDGQNWSVETLSPFLDYTYDNTYWNFYKFFKNKWYAFCGAGNYNNWFATSSDGLTSWKHYPFYWKNQYYNYGLVIGGVEIGDDLILMGDDNAEALYISTDGLSDWKIRNIAQTDRTRNLIAGYDDWILIPCYSTLDSYVYRGVKTLYDSDDYFQLPRYAFTEVAGAKSYIKVT